MCFPCRGSDQSSIFVVLAPVAGDAVQQDEPGIGLELAPELPDPAPETSAPDNTPFVDFDDWEPTLF